MQNVFKSGVHFLKIDEIKSKDIFSKVTIVSLKFRKQFIRDDSLKQNDKHVS